MKLKKLFLALVASLALLASGCGGSPESVAEKYLQALIDGNAEAANKLCTARTAPLTPFLIAAIQNQGDSVKDVRDVKVDGDKAKVYFEGSDDPLELVRVDGDWKVDIQKN